MSTETIKDLELTVPVSFAFMQEDSDMGGDDDAMGGDEDMDEEEMDGDDEEEGEEEAE